MFDGFQSRERELWIERQRQGKKKFLLTSSAALGSLFFFFIRTPLYFFALNGYNIGRSGRLFVLVIGVPLCFATGYWLSLMSWRRGVRLTNSAGEI